MPRTIIGDEGGGGGSSSSTSSNSNSNLIIHKRNGHSNNNSQMTSSSSSATASSSSSSTSNISSKHSSSTPKRSHNNNNNNNNNNTENSLNSKCTTSTSVANTSNDDIDEIKVYKDEGAAEEEQRNSENLNEDKIGLVNETEEVSRNLKFNHKIDNQLSLTNFHHQLKLLIILKYNENLIFVIEFSIVALTLIDTYLIFN